MCGSTARKSNTYTYVHIYVYFYFYFFCIYISIYLIYIIYNYFSIFAHTCGTSCNMESLASSSPSVLASICIASLSATSDMCTCTQKNVRQNINTTVRKHTLMPSFRHTAMIFCRSVRNTSAYYTYNNTVHENIIIIINT